ncbi:ExbD/TolR family protein [Candidatus Proelusimicrobium volucris]|uniref:ExbD/TolR family protein n=1 Tax=Candidatus Proelusimicrobium volucris TaxID=3416225 RepID=UPI003D0E65E7
MKNRMQTRGIMGEINMVPFIDITLILLIIFMVMTPFIVQSQINVDLPSSSAVNTITEDNVIRVEINKKGQLKVMDKEVAFSGLQEELILLLGRAHEKTILVQADKDVPIQQVVKVFDVAKKLGAAKLGIGVSEGK